MKNINGIKQNRIHLIVDDICQRYPEIDPDFIYETLLLRGAFKWFAVREDLIRLKDAWGDKVRSLQRRKPAKLKGYLHALEECRAAVRRLTHSPRLRAAVRDKKAGEFLYRYVGKTDAYRAHKIFAALMAHRLRVHNVVHIDAPVNNCKTCRNLERELSKFLLH